MVHMNTSRLQYLDTIQHVITRMADNSFKIKNWAILVNSGLLSLYFTRGRWQVLIVAMVITLVFFALDAYYLLLERLFRIKYNNAVAAKYTELFDMSIKLKFSQYVKVLKSPVMAFYVALFGISVSILVIRHWSNISNFIINCFCGG